MTPAEMRKVYEVLRDSRLLAEARQQQQQEATDDD